MALSFNSGLSQYLEVCPSLKNWVARTLSNSCPFTHCLLNQMLSEKKCKEYKLQTVACCYCTFSSVDFGLIKEADGIWMRNFWVSISQWVYCIFSGPFNCLVKTYQVQSLLYRLQNFTVVSIELCQNIRPCLACLTSDHMDYWINKLLLVLLSLVGWWVLISNKKP